MLIFTFISNHQCTKIATIRIQQKSLNFKQHVSEKGRQCILHSVLPSVYRADNPFFTQSYFVCNRQTIHTAFNPTFCVKGRVMLMRISSFSTAVFRYPRKKLSSIFTSRRPPAACKHQALFQFVRI